LIKADLPPGHKEECLIEKKVDWLHGTAKSLNKKYKIVEYSPYNPFVANNESDVIEEYFKIEEENDITVAENVVEEEKEVKKSVQDPGSIIDIDECSIFQRPPKAHKKEQKKSVLSDEWLVVE
jgi:hypothetical protein